MVEQNKPSYPIYGDESIMSKKEHGSCEKAVMENLKYGCDRETTDRVSCYNRKYAEHSGYAWQEPRTWLQHCKDTDGQETTYYDPVTGLPLFIAPRGRSMADFLAEGKSHGWPSFRDEEVVWDNVRVIAGDNEAVSTAGVHLGHNIADSKGNRYCINLVSIAGSPIEQ